jgi:bifunctional non-homologous end joining protein LigD
VSLFWRPQPLLRVTEPFDHDDWVFELKHDGFRALAHVDHFTCRLVSRNCHVFKQWPNLCEEVAHSLRVRRAVVDGEVVCLRPDGNSDFNSLLFRREWPYFYAFDLLSVDGQDLRGRPLVERRERLRDLMPWREVQSRLRYVDDVERQGSALYSAVCEVDAEGIVGKWAAGTYRTDGTTTSWAKVKNPNYSQVVGRHELFAQRRSAEGSRRYKPTYRLDGAAAVAW